MHWEAGCYDARVPSRLSIPAAAYRHPRLCEALLIPFVLLGIFWIFLGKYLRGEHSVATFLDNTHFILPLFAHISKTFAAGEFPYWINSIAGGIPLYNTPQFSILYPFYFFGWNFYRTPLDTSLHVHYVTLFHVGILWMSTYVMMRIFHLRILSSVLGATLFAFCANTYWYLFWVNIISPYSWLPLALGSVFLILENEYPKAGLALGWASIYLLTSASPAQPLIHFVFCSLFLVVSYAFIHRRDKSKLSAPLRNLVLLALGSILLSSPTLIPSAIFAQRDMLRGTDAGAVIGNQRIPFEGFLTGQTKASELAKVLFPLYVSQVLGDSYLGVLPVLLALFSFFKWKRNWIVAPLFVLALYTVLSSTGANLGFAYINYLIPLWNKIREPARHLYVFTLATCTLAAFGFEHLTDRELFRRFDLRKHALVFGVFLILLLGSYWVRQKYVTQVSDSTLLWCFGLFLGVLCVSRFVPQSHRLAQGLLAAIVLYPALSYPAPMVKIHDGDYFMEENLRSHRVLQEIAKIKDIEKYRLVVADKQFSPQFWSMNAAYYGLRTFEAFMNPLPAGQAGEMFVAPAFPRYGQLLGAKYYLICGDSPSPPAGYFLEREIEGCKLYSTGDARPYYFLSTEVGQSYTDVQKFLDRIQQSDADLSKVSVNSRDAREIAGWLGATTQPLSWETLREDRSTNSFNLSLRTNRRSLLMLNEYFRNEWQVTLNGKKQKPFKVNLNQLAVLLPEGTNQVGFEYRPRLFLWLIYVQRAAMGILAAGLVGMAISGVSKAGREDSAAKPQPSETPLLS